MKALAMLSLLLLQLTAAAQDISVKKDIVYKDDQAYCKLVKTGTLTFRYSVRTLDDHEVMVAQFDNSAKRYNVSFTESGQVCFMQGTLGFGKILARDIVNCNLIADGRLRPAGEQCFLRSHGGNAGAPAVEQANDANEEESGAAYATAERDRARPIMVFGSKITQDNVEIGSYSVRNTTSDGKVVRIFTFLLPNGQKAAEGWLEGVNAGSCRMMVLKQNKWYNITVRVFDDMGVAKEMATWLAGRYFL